MNSGSVSVRHWLLLQALDQPRGPGGKPSIPAYLEETIKEYNLAPAIDYGKRVASASRLDYLLDRKLLRRAAEQCTSLTYR